MRAFVAFDETGQITSVAIPNPEFGDAITVEAEGRSVIAVDVSDVVRSGEQPTFATGREAAGKRLQEIVSTIAEQYRVEPSTRRLSKKQMR